MALSTSLSRAAAWTPCIWLFLVAFCSVCIETQVEGASGTGFPVSLPCAAGTYFDTSGLVCRACGQFQVLLPDGSGCKCKAGFAFLADSTGKQSCQSCLIKGQVASSDGTVCVGCNSTLGAVLNTATGECECSAGSALVEFDNAGTRLPAKACTQCPAGAHISSVEPELCQVCSGGQVFDTSSQTCQCPVGSKTCVQGSSLLASTAQRLGVNMDGSTLVNYYDIPTPYGGGTTKSLNSDLFAQMLPLAATCAASGDRAACNALANLCVLELYDRSSAACELYNALVTSKQNSGQYHTTDGWSDTLPWLYYSGDAESWLRRTDLQSSVSFQHQAPGSSSAADVTLVLSMFTLNGTWLGFQNLTRQFQLCNGNEDDVNQWQRIGTDYENSCDLKLTAVQHFEQSDEPIFYDIYFQDGTNLYPVPLLMLDYRSQGKVANHPLSSGLAVNNVLTRRMFLMDFVSGKVAGAKPQAVRYAESIELLITLQPGTKSRIYPPSITVKYATRDPQYEGSVANQASFSVLYTMGKFGFWSVWTIMIIICLVVSFFFWCFQMFSYVRRRPEQLLDLVFLLRGVIEAARIVSRLFFLLSICGAAYWFIFFKMQSVVYVMMPTDKQVKSFRLVLIVAFVGELINILDILWRQTHYDIFFVDWEKSKLTIGPSGNKEPAPVSVWRTLFVANEWEELQVKRQTCIEFTLFALLFLLVALRLEGLSNIHPTLFSLSQKDYYQSSCILRFFISTILWLAVSILQRLLTTTILHRYVENPLIQFVDLASLANVSVFIFEDLLCGYYIHGRSLMTFADTSMLVLNAELRKEQEGVVSNRGLLSSAKKELADSQVFEIYITSELRQKYDAKFLRRISETRPDTLASPTRPRHARQPGGAYRAVHELPEDTMIRAQEEIASLFRNFVNQMEAEVSKRIVVKRTLQKLLDMPPDMAAQRSPIFYHDFSNRFGRVTFYGIEGHLMIFNIMVFTMADLCFKSTTIALFVTYLVERLLKFVRSALGQANTSRKSLIDSRFLI
ncbi:Meckelin-like protein [Klebsormidium nitens]|uniref:Meckelin-like protein n=1 Tax=Klebsormidium nitens TaxID=105231 RepID=A0A1Y1IMV0_KLENI|nr:Meckelin-like protein [Klebsormidium nitens]|eukprot:GAQ91983.1 Meckelin-like protein [Klebsormidium nitens]